MDPVERPHLAAVDLKIMEYHVSKRSECVVLMSRDWLTFMDTTSIYFDERRPKNLGVFERCLHLSSKVFRGGTVAEHPLL